MSDHSPEPEAEAGADATSAPDAPAQRSVFSRYKVPIIASGVGLVVVALILRAALGPGAPYSDIAECEDLFTDELLTQAGLEGATMSAVDTSDPFGNLPSPGPDGLCGDSSGNSVAAAFTLSEPDPSSTDYSDVTDRVAEQRQQEQAYLDGSDERDDAPYTTTELEDIEAGDGGYVALYEPIDPVGLAYREWNPTEHGRSHAQAVVSTRNAHLSVFVYDAEGDLPTRAPMDAARLVAEALVERIADTSETE